MTTFRESAVTVFLLLCCLVLWLWLIPSHVTVFPGGSSGPGPTFFPYLLTLILGLLCMGRLIQIVLRPEVALPAAGQIPDGEEETPPLPWRWIGLAAVALAVFYLLILLVGMCPACFIALLVFCRGFGITRLFTLLVTATSATLCLYLFFAKLAMVPLPAGLLGDALF